MRRVVVLMWVVVLWPTLSTQVPALRQVSRQIRGEVHSVRAYLQQAQDELTVTDLGGMNRELSRAGLR